MKYSGIVDVDTHVLIFDIKGLVGLDLTKRNPSTVTALYTGLGYRYFADDPDDHYDDQIYMLQTYIDTVYLPIGLDFSRDVGKGGRFGARAEFNIGLSSSYKIEDVGDTLFSDDFDSSIGFSLSGYYRFGSRVKFKVEPFLRTWGFSASSLQQDFSQMLLGVNLGVSF